LSFTRSVTPSFLISAGALESNLVSLSVGHTLTDHLTASTNVNYARSSSAAGTTGSAVTFDSYGTGLILSYSISRSFGAAFTYSHSHFSSDSLSFKSTFDRDVVALSLTASWM
jgi:outer membrane protein assembly factor BamA